MNGKRVEADRIFSNPYVHGLRSTRSLAALAHALRALRRRRWRLTSGSHGLARIRQASDCSVAALLGGSRLDSEDSLRSSRIRRIHDNSAGFVGVLGIARVHSDSLGFSRIPGIR